MAEEAKKRNLVTQMGNQGHARRGRPARLRMDLGRRDRRRHRGPCLDQPADLAAGHRRPEGDPLRPADPRLGRLAGPGPVAAVPSGLRPFRLARLVGLRHGRLGDMGAHLIDQPFWALKLGHPLTVQASSSSFTKDSYPDRRDRSRTSSRRAGIDAAGEDGLVRRRADAAAAGEHPRRPDDGRRRRRRASSSGPRGRSCAAPTATIRASCPNP